MPKTRGIPGQFSLAIFSLSSGLCVPALAQPLVQQTAVADGPSLEPFDAGAYGKFTFVGMPDTQNYSEFYPEIYESQTKWITRQAARKNIRFVSHYGDVVNHGDRENEWKVADKAMKYLDDAGIKYHVSAGNHDVTPSGGAGTPFIPQNYLKYFGADRFAGKSWYKGDSPSGMSNYQVFKGGGREFIAMSISVDTPLAELEWAQGVLNTNRDKAVILTTHRYLQDAEDYTSGVPIVPSGRYPDIWYGVEGQYDPSGMHSEEFFDSFVRRNQNIMMVNCGHFHEEYRQTSTNIYGNTVHEVLADYQDDPNGGNGFLRLMEFDVAAKKVDVKSYSTWLNRYETKDESQFTLNVDFDRYRSTTPVVTFQQGINGYNGTQDTWISEQNKGSSYGSNTTVNVDDDVNNSIFNDRRGQGLLRFDNIITASGQAGMIPLGATVTEATLRLTISDDIDNPLFNPKFRIYMMTRAWDENSTWDSLAGGLTAGADYGILLGEFIGDNNPDADFLRIINVQAAVQAWANGAANYGFAILPEIIGGNDDGIEFWSSEHFYALYRPQLEVRYITGGGLIPAPGSLVALTVIGVFGTARRRRG
jgi:hypothetical protein